MLRKVNIAHPYGFSVVVPTGVPLDSRVVVDYWGIVFLIPDTSVIIAIKRCIWNYCSLYPFPSYVFSTPATSSAAKEKTMTGSVVFFLLKIPFSSSGGLTLIRLSRDIGGKTWHGANCGRKTPKILKTLEKGNHPSHSLRRSAPSSSDCPPRPGFSGAGFPRCCPLASLPFLEEFERRLEVSGTWWGDRAHGRMRARVLQRFVGGAWVVVLSLLLQSCLHHLGWNYFGFLVELSIRRSWRCICSFAIVVIKVRYLNIITVLVFKSNSYFCNKGKGKCLNLL